MLSAVILLRKKLGRTLPSSIPAPRLSLCRYYADSRCRASGPSATVQRSICFTTLSRRTIVGREDASLGQGGPSGVAVVGRRETHVDDGLGEVAGLAGAPELNAATARLRLRRWTRSPCVSWLPAAGSGDRQC